MFYSVYEWFRNFFGNVFILFAIIGFVIVWITALYYRFHRPNKPSYEGKKKIALITGASSGLGEEFAKCIDTDEDGIDEVR